MSDKNDRFDGKGFSSEEFTPEERAAHRHMYRTVRENWVPLDETTYRAMKEAATVMTALSILSKVLKIWPVVLTMLGAGAFARSQGWL